MCQEPTVICASGKLLAPAFAVGQVLVWCRVARLGAKLPGTYPPNAQTRAAFEAWRKERSI